MPAFKTPTFQERTAAAATARSRALALLRSKPQADETAVAEALARRAAREATEAEKRTAARAARALAAAHKQASKAEAAQIAATHVAPEPTEADRKAARDARYAARKERKSSP